jgi:FdhD protein
VWVYEKGRFLEAGFSLPRERTLTLFVNGVPYATLSYTPKEEEALALGRLYLDGVIRGLEDVLGLEATPEGVEVRTRTPLPEGPLVEAPGCGGGTYRPRPLRPLPPLSLDPQLPVLLVRILQARAEEYARTRGVHSAALFDPQGNFLFLAEDISRHNALDRLAGKALLQGLEGPFLVAASGRASMEMVLKSVALGAVLLASRTGATDRAVGLARSYGLALACYVRPTGYRLYAGKERFKSGTPPGAP